MRFSLLLLVVSCGGSEPVPVDSGTDSIDTAPAPTTGPKTELKYTADWQGLLDLLDDRCAGCHAGPTADLKFPGAFEADLQTLRGNYIVPFDPDASKLWRVLADDLEPGDFSAMPWVPGPLKERFIDHVRMWIEAGAPSPHTADPDDIDWDADGFSVNEGDCDDADDATYPGADEHCDGIDRDCDGSIDEDPVDPPLWYPDLDGDGFGAGIGIAGCEGPSGHVDDNTDCDDADRDLHPYAGDPVDGVDNDCDGDVDEGYTFSFAADIQPILDASCVTCHTSPLTPAYLDMSVDAYGALVSVPSGELPTMNRIEPAEPSLSYLFHKIESTHLDVGGQGEQMPQYGPYLDPGNRDVIEGWIYEGARP